MSFEPFNSAVYHLIAAVTAVVTATFSGQAANPAPIVIPVHAASTQSTASPGPGQPESSSSALIYTVVLPAASGLTSTDESTQSALIGPVKPKAASSSAKKNQTKLPPSPSPSVIPASSSKPSSRPDSGSTVDIPAPSALLKPGNNPEIIFNLINQHRASLNLPVFEKDDRLCKIAEYRAPQLDNEIFGSVTIHQGFYDLKLPYWATENAASYKGEQTVVNWWLGDEIHRKAIESTKDKYTCGACSGNSCSQIFSSFTPK